LNALRHEKTYEQKFETQAARRAEPLHQYSGSLNTCKNNGSGGEPACQINVPVAKFAEMKVIGIFCAISSFALWPAAAESPAPHEGKSAESAQLEALAKKIDEQNAKIDALSQEILRLEQQLSHARPGVMIGEASPAPATAAAPAASASHSPVEGNTHTVARGETLTSIAKMYKVTVDDLQQANHIEDGRKLQAGQTIIIPTASPAASGSPSS
jgi:LysM repeat protein